MKIVLKSDWDMSAQLPDKQDKNNKGHFVGRETELSIFVNELIRKEQGAILITGYRGVGKSSFAHRALQQVLDYLDKNKVIFVFVNASHLEMGSNRHNINPKSILVNLIRRLYSVTEDEKISSQQKRDIEALYKKAVSSEFRSQEAVEVNRKTSRETEISKQTSLETQQISIQQLVWMVSFMLAVFLQAYPLLLKMDWLNKILPLLFAFPIPVFLSWAVQYRKTSITSESSSGSAQELYTVDNSISNLEFDLEKLHRKIAKSDIKLIYILDELDKLEAEQVFEVMKYYKNLFTLSSAIFVFIAGEELFAKYQSVGERESEVYRPVEHTYFTSKYFLARPADIDLSKLIDEITKSVDELEVQNSYDDYKRSLIFDAKCDYFDLVQTIKGKITSFDGLNPVIIDKVDDQIILKAKLQKTISVLYNEKYIAHHPSRWLENESVLRKLYEDAHNLLMASPDSDVVDSENESWNRYKGSIQELAVNDFHSFLYRLGFLELADYTRTISRGRDSDWTITSNKYKLTKVMSDIIPEKVNFLSQMEEQLRIQIETLHQIILNCWNIYATFQNIPTASITQFRQNPLIYTHKMNLWGIKVTGTINELEPIYKKLVDSSPPESIKREDIEADLKHVSETINSILEDSHKLVAKIFQDALPNKNLQITTLNECENFFSGYINAAAFRQGMISSATPHCILASPDFSKQVLYCRNISNNSVTYLMNRRRDDTLPTSNCSVVIVDEKQEQLIFSNSGSVKILSLVDDYHKIDKVVNELVFDI